MPETVMIKSQNYFNADIPFCINKCSYDKYEDIRLHSHEFVEIAYVCSGKGIHVIGNQTYEVSKGDLYIINFETPHSFYARDRNNSDGLAVCNCMFMPQFIENLNMELSLLKELVNIFLYESIYAEELEYSPDLRLTGKLYTDIENIYEKMLREYTIRQEGYVEVLKILVSELLIKIYRAYKSQNKNRMETDRYKYQLIYDSIAYLKKNYSSRLNLDQISQHSFLSKSYYSALFKKATGMSVFEFLQKVRIEKACQLLTSENCKVSEIAEAVGYTDYRFFNKTFKRIMGVTAQEYKKGV